MTSPTSPLVLYPDACPCCGYNTIDERAEYEICRVCWWEDDGSDNHNAYLMSGANKLRLTRARANFLTEGIAEPSRTDLRAQQALTTSHIAKRFFVFDPTTSTVSEPATGWSATLDALDENAERSCFSIGDTVIYRCGWLDTDTQIGRVTHVEWEKKRCLAIPAER